MLRILLIAVVTVLTSFYFFPFEFVSLPGINTKMVLAAIGLVMLVFSLAGKRKAEVDKDILSISLYAVAISFISFIAITVNGTNDQSFTTYFISMWVWLAGAYTVCRAIKAVHGHLSVELVSNYLIVVCCLQCLLALSMDLYPPLKEFVDSFLGDSESFMGKAEGRLYGIGCALDVAGLRFSAVLVIIACLCMNGSPSVSKNIGWYIAAFLVMALIGNMISRTTTMGVILAVIYWSYCVVRYVLTNDGADLKFLKWLGVSLAVLVPVLILLYNVSPALQTNIRFAFEGFFSLFETGKWQVHSNDILLKHMIVLPDTFRTWVIGDGYAANPVTFPENDPYYIGENYHGYYKGTDIGYLRYIFYFGLVGLGAFIAYFCKVASVCAGRFRMYRMMFLMVLAVNFIGWLKVSTDIFLVFAIFLCISRKDEEKYEMRLSDGGGEVLGDGDDIADMSEAPADIDRK